MALNPLNNNAPPTTPPPDPATGRVRALEAEMESMRIFADYAKAILQIPRPNVEAP